MRLQGKAKFKCFFKAVFNLASFAIPHLTPQTQPLVSNNSINRRTLQSYYQLIGLIWNTSKSREGVVLRHRWAGLLCLDWVHAMLVRQMWSSGNPSFHIPSIPEVSALHSFSNVSANEVTEQVSQIMTWWINLQVTENTYWKWKAGKIIEAKVTWTGDNSKQTTTTIKKERRKTSHLKLHKSRNLGICHTRNWVKTAWVTMIVEPSDWDTWVKQHTTNKTKPRVIMFAYILSSLSTCPHKSLQTQCSVPGTPWCVSGLVYKLLHQLPLFLIACCSNACWSLISRCVTAEFHVGCIFRKSNFSRCANLQKL